MGSFKNDGRFSPTESRSGIISETMGCRYELQFRTFHPFFRDQTLTHNQQLPSDQTLDRTQTLARDLSG
jgi:hypothetical protein